MSKYYIPDDHELSIKEPIKFPRTSKLLYYSLSLMLESRSINFLRCNIKIKIFKISKHLKANKNKSKRSSFKIALFQKQ